MRAVIECQAQNISEADFQLSDDDVSTFNAELCFIDRLLFMKMRLKM